jgi:hypothetical protein
MSEEKSEKQMLLAEHKKANDALMQIKKGMSWENKNINTLSLALANIFKIIMQSNKEVRQSMMRPIRIKNLEDKKPIKALRKKDRKMAAKKAVKKVTKKPAKKMGKK